MLDLLDPADRVYVTSNTLTETSNLLGQHGEPERSHLFDGLRFIIHESEEVVVASTVASQNSSFGRLGLADAALLEVISADERRRGGGPAGAHCDGCERPGDRRCAGCGLSAYDAELVVLARTLGVPLVTLDGGILSGAGDVAVRLGQPLRWQVLPSDNYSSSQEPPSQSS